MTQMTYREFFEALTGFPPFCYQERIADLLLARESVILRVPTGAGKTWASVAPFLYSLAAARPIADRLLYALPLRSLAGSLHADVLSHMQASMPNVWATGKDREYGKNMLHCSLQTGAQKDDPFFESELVFTTIDQLLSSYVLHPVSLSERLGNINAGALIGSLLVFDEVHLLDPDVAMGTVVEMLDRLNGLAQFVLMTATLSEEAIGWFANKLGATEVPITDDEIRALPAQRTKARNWQWIPHVMTASAVKETHKGGRTIALVNSVSGAQDFFQELETLYRNEPEAPELLLLHARFFPNDRRAVEDRVAEYLGPKAIKSNVILVTTQVAEAGMDISADQLHTELAPINALIQRAGRVARYEHRNIGSVAVYELAGLGPYRDQKVVIDDSRSVLATGLPHDRAVDFLEERDWIDSVHSRVDLAQLSDYDSLWARRALVHKAMDEEDRSRLRQLVRDIDSVSVLIHTNPEEVDFSGRRWPLLLGVPGVSLMRLSKFFSSVGPKGWVAKGACAASEEEQAGLSLQWEPISSPGHLRSQWLLAIHSDFASYDRRLGLVLGLGAPQPPLRYADLPSTPRYQYEFETWAKHSQRVVAQMQAMQTSYSRGSALLRNKYNLALGIIEKLVELACALHDVGKLASEWQKTAWRWQDDKDARMRASGQRIPERLRVPIAHTWFDPVADKECAKAAIYRLPPHAVQGAYAVTNLVCNVLSEQFEGHYEIAARSLISAVARHHGPRVSKLTRFSLDPRAGATVKSCVGEFSTDSELLECSDLLEEREFSDVLLAFGREDDQAAWPLYAFLVRRLRLADQGSFTS